MKKALPLILICVLLAALVSCAAGDGVENETKITGTSGRDPETLTQPLPSSESSAPSDTRSDGIPDVYRQVLANQKSFTLFDERIFISDYRFPYSQESFPLCDSVEYALCDMDADGGKELLLRGTDDDILILREENGSVYGYDFIFRNMYDVKVDGSFSWNENAGNTYGVSKIRFSGETYSPDEQYRVETDPDTNVTKYFVLDSEVSEEEFSAKTGSVPSAPPLEWNKLS